ncbi:MAG: polysaccharide export protein EpsE [Rugosibacter sp.]|nr:polysaccharide export protein EpsE [Rugosibacter sp.]
MSSVFTRILAFALLFGIVISAQAADSQREYVLGAGDNIRIGVFQNPDLAIETRISESGSITFPLVGAVPVGGLSIFAAEQKVAQMLHDGGFVVQPQVNIQVVEVRSNQVAVLGQIGRPGRFPLENPNTKVSDMLAIAGGVAAGGADTLILTGVRDGKPMRKEIDIPAMFQKGDFSQDMVLQGGDIIYVHRAPLFYIYGEVQRPGSYRLERDMTVRHALAQAGGVSLRGTDRGLRLHRRGKDGSMVQQEPEMDAVVLSDDVLYIRESLF